MSEDVAALVNGASGSPLDAPVPIGYRKKPLHWPKVIVVGLLFGAAAAESIERHPVIGAAVFGSLVALTAGWLAHIWDAR